MTLFLCKCLCSMNKKFGILVVLLAGAIFIWGLVSIAVLIFIKYKGTPISATIIKVDSECDKYNHIEVLFESRYYRVSISRQECRKGVYKVGQHVTLLKHKDFNELVWPESQIQWMPFLLLILLALLYYSYREKLVRSRKTDSG